MSDELQPSLDPTGDALLEQLAGVPRAGEEAVRAPLEPKPEAAPEQKPEVVEHPLHTAMMIDQVLLPQGMEWDHAVAEPILGELRDAGIEGIKSLAHHYAASGCVFEGSAEDALAELRNRWSPHEFERKIAGAKELVSRLSPAMRKQLDETGFGNSPEVIVAFADAAERQNLGVYAPPERPKPGERLSPAAAKAEYDRVLADTSHAYWDPEAIGHKAAVQHLAALASRAFDH